jgi:phosphoglucomutase
MCASFSDDLEAYMSECVNPLAGRPVSQSLLVDILRKMIAYFAPGPDPAIISQRVVFGASGRRGSAFASSFNDAPGNNQAIGGIKALAKSGRFAARPSRTEDVYKIYAESFRSGDHLKQIQVDAQALVGHLFEKK